MEAWQSRVECADFESRKCLTRVFVGSNPTASATKYSMSYMRAWINLVNEASGYIPSEEEKDDPRYKTALTVDVRPQTMKKGAAGFGSKISRAGVPPILRTDGKI